MITGKPLENLTASADDAGDEQSAEERADEILDEVNEEFAEAIEAAKKIDAPHLLAILTHGGMGAWENCTNDPVNSLEDLVKITEMVVTITADYIGDIYGEEAMAFWLAHLLADNL